RPIWGYLAQRLSSRRIYYVTLAGLASGFAGMALVHNAYLFVALGVGVGFLAGANVVLYTLMLVDFFGTASLGSISGITQPINAGAQALAPVLPALVAEATGSLESWLSISAALAVANTVLVHSVHKPSAAPVRSLLDVSDLRPSNAKVAKVP